MRIAKSRRSKDAGDITLVGIERGTHTPKIHKYLGEKMAEESVCYNIRSFYRFIKAYFNNSPEVSGVEEEDRANSDVSEHLSDRASQTSITS